MKMCNTDDIDDIDDNDDDDIHKATRNVSIHHSRGNTQIVASSCLHLDFKLPHTSGNKAGRKAVVKVMMMKGFSGGST